MNKRNKWGSVFWLLPWRKSRNDGCVSSGICRSVQNNDGGQSGSVDLPEVKRDNSD